MNVPWYVGFRKKEVFSERQLREWDVPYPFSEAGSMSTARTRRRPANCHPAAAVAKPKGVLHPRVQHVGLEHFGIVCFSCLFVFGLICPVISSLGPLPATPRLFLPRHSM